MKITLMRTAKGKHVPTKTVKERETQGCPTVGLDSIFEKNKNVKVVHHPQNNIYHECTVFCHIQRNCVLIK